MLGVHGRREFNALPEQWQRGDILEVGVMCPSGFSLVPYDLDGPDQMNFKTNTLEGCAAKCQEVAKCSSFEFAHSDSSCSTFSEGAGNFKAFLGRPNAWISCARAELLPSPSTVALDAAKPSESSASEEGDGETPKATIVARSLGRVSLAALPQEPYAWKKALGSCFSVGNMTLMECHESCRSQLSCTAYQLLAPAEILGADELPEG
eukprot:Skav205932  [mRNA]  locus=scaffold2739:47330:54538:- [translate_table: standard]